MVLHQIACYFTVNEFCANCNEFIILIFFSTKIFFWLVVLSPQRQNMLDFLLFNCLCLYFRSKGFFVIQLCFNNTNKCNGTNIVYPNVSKNYDLCEKFPKFNLLYLLINYFRSKFNLNNFPISNP